MTFAGYISQVYLTWYSKRLLMKVERVTIGFYLLAHLLDKASGLAATRQLNQMPTGVLNKKVFFSNNLPYIKALEYGGYPDPVKLGTYDKKLKEHVKKSSGGFSKQAPGGWVRTTLIAMANKVRKL